MVRRQTDVENRVEGWSLHYSCSYNGRKLSPYGKLGHAASQLVKVVIIKTTTSTHLIWQSEAGSLPVCSTHSALCCICNQTHMSLHLNMHMHSFFSVSNPCFSLHPTHVPRFPPFFPPPFTPLSFWSTSPFHLSSSSNPERLICDWACCVFYRRLAAARGQRAAEMPQCLYILPVRRCKRMKRDWHSIILAEKLKYSRGWMEADKEDEDEGEEERGAFFCNWLS